MNVCISSENIIMHEISSTKGVSEKLRMLAEITPFFKSGKLQNYLSDLFGQAELDKLEMGHSAVIAADVGTGKSTAVLKTAAAIHDGTAIYILTNRKYCLIQQKREYLRFMGISVSNWSNDAVMGYDTENVKFMTYQKLAKKGGVYKFPKGSVIILDEIHYIFNDAVFSSDPMIIKNILHLNQSFTKRIYISATMDEVLDEIILLESKYTEPMPIESIFRNDERYKINDTYIDQIYIMESNWEHICFKFYNYCDIDKLAEYLNQNNHGGKKSLVFIRNKERGKKLKEKLTNCEMVYSTNDEIPILSEISDNAKYACGSLISTKVLENGVSITDTKVDTIVIDEIDPIAFKQFLGRVRNSRVNPRKLTIIIPDYSLGELTQLHRQYYQKIKVIQEVINNPEYCMANFEMYAPYVYYDLTVKSPMPNYLALKKFTNLYNYVSNLIEEEKVNPHAHIRSIQRLLYLPENIEDKQFLNYDDTVAFKEGVTVAYEEFIKSSMRKQDRDKLAQMLIKVISSTSVYPKKITGAQLQLDKINDILACAGIQSKIQSLGEAFGLVE